MFTIKYGGLRLIPTISAMRELMQEGKTLYSVLTILEEGCNAPRRRKEGTIEKWLNKGNKTYNVVVVKDFNYDFNEDVWLIIHFGKFTRK